MQRTCVYLFTGCPKGHKKEDGMATVSTYYAEVGRRVVTSCQVIDVHVKRSSVKSAFENAYRPHGKD